MNNILRLWRRFKDRPDQWFFYAFLVSFPFSIRKILYFIPIKGSFNEFTSASIYLSDIFLLLTIISWIFVLYYNNIYLSSIISSAQKMFHACPVKCSTPAPSNVPRGTFLLGWNIFQIHKNISYIQSLKKALKNLFTQLIHSKIIIALLFISFFSFISIIWSEDKTLALYKSIKNIEVILIILYVSKNVPRGTFLLKMLLLLSFSGLVHGMFGIIQFINQKSLGLFWLKESIISPEMTGIAKIIFNGDVFIRSYGIFPHPNILGGFLVLTIISTLLFFEIIKEIVPRGTINSNNQKFKLFHVEQLIQEANKPNCSTWNNSSNKSLTNKKLYSLYIKFWPYRSLFLIFQIIALILTFSKSALFGLILAFFYIKYFERKNILSTSVPLNVPRLPRQLFHVEQFDWGGTFLPKWNIFNTESRKYILILLILINVFFLILKPNIYSLIGRSVEDRLNLISIFNENVLDKAFFGVGSGQYVLEISKIQDIENWKITPVHNVFILLIGELGIIPFIIFIIMLLMMLRNKVIIPRLSRQMFHACPVNCSTWNNLTGVEHFYRDGTIINTKVVIYMKGLLLAIILIMMLDHYIWTIWQGQIILGITIGLLI